MLTYLFITFLILTISIASIDKRVSSQYYIFSYFVIWVLLTLFSGLRTIGFDYTTYNIHFESLKDILNYERIDYSMELGYELFISLCKTFSNSFHFALLTFSGLNLALTILLYKKYSPYPLLSFFMFFAFSYYPQVMGQMRQPFAIILTYLAIIPLIERRKYLIAGGVIMLFAFLFHKSIFFMLLIFLFKDKILSLKCILLCFSTSIIIYTLSAFVINILLNYIPDQFYLKSTIDLYLTTRLSNTTFTMGMVERFCLIVIIFYYSFKYHLYENDKILRLFINIYFIGVCLYFSMISVSAEFASRGSHGLTYSLFIILPTLAFKIKSKERLIIIVIIISWSLYLSTSIFNSTEYIPYKNVISLCLI